MSSVAASPGNEVIVEGLLFGAGNIGFVRAAFLFSHVGEHFAISPRFLVDHELPVAQLFELCDSFFQLFFVSLEFFQLPVGGMNMVSGEGLEEIFTACCIGRRNRGICTFQGFACLRDFEEYLLQHALFLFFEDSANPKHGGKRKLETHISSLSREEI